ncbi:hydrolase, HD family [Marvinbryantia formatexigens DSM 14469]|uniref:bis(5'-nucleosyl)-tetraphosphatase (symmetrical) n=1 Tax=Marvinbryantia formatexigens DSM 14469 TaxID=478749 RepID=C6LC74_9FIRM|nr:bis(5'-nucleosyl)-tetraphosphatase (symmetrical) YqeK [Marvinbryantia formatexigens]EET61538.1 hydrolase, HD family [Marvinbryantia formatexigens DSM 14469]UWO24624.1 bis(5'-nucleosyl)-tetraphosphatase (symmetrical) YqeK [Marvinbryantia formatexigens DSM 14469]SDF16167.1 putative HD superfamily hydrolase of NAD metabolism [Marvinbryantia formatexigens]
MAMYNIPKMKKTLKKYLDAGRFEHTEGVMYTAAALAMRYGEDIEKAQVAGLLHDCAKCMPDAKKVKICQKNGIPMTEAEQKSPFLLHAKVGAYIAQTKYGIEDTEILEAIECHTTGKPAMSQLDKIIFIADYIEPMRTKAPDLADVRKLAFKDIDLALFKILSDTLAYLRNSPKNVDSMTMRAYEYYKKQVLD